MDIEKFEKGYLEFCESKSQPGYKWGVYSSDVFTYLRSSEFKNLNMYIVSKPKGTVCRHCKAENVKLINGLCYGCICLKV